MKNDLKSTNLGRAELIQVLSDKFALDKKTASGFLETLIDSLTEVFKNEKSLKIQGFGTFSVHKKKARPGRNPKTKQEKTISERTVVRLKPSPLLQKRLNDNVR